jgi:hypothetical protein
MNKDIETLFATANALPPKTGNNEANSTNTDTNANTDVNASANANVAAADDVPSWLSKLKDPNYDPFTPNFNTTSEPDDTDVKNEDVQAQEEEKKEEKPAESAVVEEPPSLTPEQQAALENERRATEAALENALDKFYAIPDDIKSTLPEGVGEFLQKQQVRAHKAVVNHISAILTNIQQNVLPNLVANLVQNQGKVVEAEREFYAMYPQLSDPSLKKDILDAAQVLAPKLQGKNLKERMTMIGAYVALTKGLDPRPSTSAGSTSNSVASASGNIPPSNAPIIPSRAAAATPAIGANRTKPTGRNADIASLWAAFNQ